MAERICGVWHRAGSCILAPRHAGQHRNAAEVELEHLRAANAALQQAVEQLLSERDMYMRRLGLLLPWLGEHRKEHDSDTLDVDHGPTVEWDYCGWCQDHGLPEDWPCVFAQAANPALTQEVSDAAS